MDLSIIELFIILFLVFVLPFLFKKIEEEIEIFLFIMGILSVTITKQWSLHLIEESLVEPIKITVAVLIAGLLFKEFRTVIVRFIEKSKKFLGIRLFVFFVVLVLGLVSSVITAIIAAIILVEIISNLKLDRENEIKIIVVACFSIGFGAALTPIGEPLATIAIAKLKGPPYFADFFFLLKNLSYFIIPAIIVISILAFIIIPDKREGKEGLTEHRIERKRDILLRTFKVYLFVMALVFLGTGFKPMIDLYVSKIPFFALYWINIISAVLDNATLVAAEIGPSMNIKQIDAALIGLIISGGMLIPGNIPNIIAASKLKIKSKEWAKIGVPLGFILLIIYFIILYFINK